MSLLPALLAQPAGASLAQATSSTATPASPWQIQKTPALSVKEGEFYGTSCTSVSDCVAVGFRLDSHGSQAALAELWNGTNWSTMKGASPSGAAESGLSGVTCISASDCVAVGQTDEAPLAEVWNGTSWTIEDVPTTAVIAVLGGVSCASADQCMAVGSAVSLKKTGELAEEAFAVAWNGAAWTQTKAPKISGSMGASLASVSCLAAGTCEAVGSYENESAEPTTLAESWNGTSWVAQVTAPTGSSYSGLNSVSCVSASDCIAVGIALPGSLAETWNGTHWSLVTTPDPPGSEGSELFGVSCTSGTMCTSVGGYQNSSGADLALAMSWNGKSWTIQPTPSPSPLENGLLSVSCTSESACTAVGAYVSTKNPSLLLVEVWDGTTWSTQHPFQKRSPLGAALYHVSCTSGSFCMAVGDDELGDPIAEEWNGSSWKFTPAPAGNGGGGLFDVTCITTTDCIAVGAPNTEEDGLAEQWNGKTWVVLQTPSGEGELESVSCTSASACVAVGTALEETGPVPLAESWNGTEWKVMKLAPVGSGSIETELLSVSCGSAESCVTVGVALSEEEVGSPVIESWNGTKWSTENSAAGSPANLGLTGVSCTSAARCMVTGYSFDRLGSPEAYSEISNGTTWKTENIPSPGGGAVLYDLECSSSNACVTVGGGAKGALAEGWNGKIWTVEKAVNPPGSGTSTYLEGVDCTTSTACTAVGDYTNKSGLELTLAEAS